MKGNNRSARRAIASDARKRPQRAAARDGQWCESSTISAFLNAVGDWPDEALLTEPECRVYLRTSGTSLWRLGQTEVLLKPLKIGSKRNVRRLGNLRKYVEKQLQKAQPKRKRLPATALFFR